MEFMVTSNAESVASGISTIDANVRTRIVQSCDELSQRIELSEKSLIRKKTRAAMNSITRLAVGEMSRVVGPSLPYTWIIEKGRKQVLPVNKKALFWEGLDHPVKRAKPWDGDPFVQPSLELGRTLLLPTFQNNIAYALR